MRGKCAENMAAREKVLRVAQLDVLELDEELAHAFESKFTEIFQLTPYSALFTRLKPEIKALTKLLLWYLSVRRTGSTVGQDMMGLAYSRVNDPNLLNPPTLLTRYMLFAAVILGWAKDRLENVIEKVIPNYTYTHSERITDILNSMLKLAQCVNFCSFLLYGVYPSLRERLLGLRMLSLEPQTLRQPSYDFMNREIIWYGFSEFLFFVLPEINFFALRNYVRRKLASVGIKRFDIKSQQSRELLPWQYNKCSHCKCCPILPQAASGCGHVFCYYCVGANLMADNAYPCDLCGKTVEGFNHVAYSEIMV